MNAYCGFGDVQKKLNSGYIILGAPSHLCDGVCVWYAEVLVHHIFLQ